LACVLKYPFIICKPYALFSDFPYKNKPRNAPNYTLIIPAVESAVNMESRRCYFTGEENHPKKKNGIEKLALTNNMAAVGIRTLLAVSADGTLSNDPSPSQLLYIYTPAAVV